MSQKSADLVCILCTFYSNNVWSIEGQFVKVAVLSHFKMNVIVSGNMISPYWGNVITNSVLDSVLKLSVVTSKFHLFEVLCN
jgi:hypothetical protein